MAALPGTRQGGLMLYQPREGMPMNTSKQLLALSAALLLAACGGKEEPAPPAAEAEAPPPVVAPEVSAPADASPESAAAPGVGVDAHALYASRCASCHGETAEGVAGNPSLAKLSAADIQSRLEAYRAGQAVGPKSAIMMPMAKNLSDAEIEALATYLGS